MANIAIPTFSPATERQHVGWVDALRVLPCFLVVLAHCCDGMVAQFDTDPAAFYSGVMIGSLVRPCVPLFVMMTGVLLLPISSQYTLRGFYRKRIGRLLWPLVFWSLVLPVIGYLYIAHVNPATANPSLDLASYTREGTIGRMLTFVFNFNYDTTPLWYLYMLIGLYLVMPILNAWLVQASKQDIQTVLGVWIFSMCLPLIKIAAPILGYQGNYGNWGLLGECDWNIYGTFYYMSGFVGYLILAYYLVHYPLQWSGKRLAAIGLPMFIVGYLITSIGFIITQQYYPGNYAYLEIMWYFCGINVFLMTFPLYVVMQRLKIGHIGWLTRMAGLTFGIYLCHFVVIYGAYDLFDIPQMPYMVRILATCVVVFVISSIVVWVMQQCRWSSRLVK